MHSLQDYNLFTDWFMNQFEQYSLPIDTKPKVPSIQKESLKSTKKFDIDTELQSALKCQPSDESVCSSARAKNAPNLYQKMRDKRKTSAQRKQEEINDNSGHKYENIINKLEA